MTDVETALRQAMAEATHDLYAEPTAYLGRAPRRRWSALAAAASVIGIAAAATLLAHQKGTPERLVAPPADRDTSVASLFGSWGPTRGDLAQDGDFLAAVRAEWDAPKGTGRVAGFTPLTNPQDDFTVLWAGNTPAGGAAVAVQTESQAPGQTDVVIGIMVPGPGASVRMVQQQNLVGGFGDALDGVPDPDGFVFSPDPRGQYVVVVPSDEDAEVTLSPRHTLVAGKVVRQFQTLTVRRSIATADLGSSHVPGDEIVRVVSSGKTVVDQPIAATLAPYRPEPANVVPEWGVNGLFLGGSRVDGFRSFEQTRPWLRLLGAPDSQPVRNSPWGGPISVTPEGGRVFAVQLSLPGEDAHVVVMQEDAEQRESGDAQVVSDEVADRDDKPLFATRLLRGQGWFVGSGPGAEVEAWREVGRDWHEVEPFKAALLDTDALGLELRFTDGTSWVSLGR